MCIQWKKKEEIWLSPVTKTPTSTEQSKKQRLQKANFGCKLDLPVNISPVYAIVQLIVSHVSNSTGINVTAKFIQV